MGGKNLLKESKAYYDDNFYYEIFSKAEDSRCEIANYFTNVINGGVVLDAGCGTGKYTKLLENISDKYIGIDLSGKQLDVAIKKSEKETTEFIKANLANIPLKNNSVDVIICTWVLGTIIDLEERKKCIDEFRRVLKKDGRIILVENACGGEFEWIRERLNDNRTNDYNKWLLKMGFKEKKKFSSYFLFESTEVARKCFEIIYGQEKAKKINREIIGHEILIFELKT